MPALISAGADPVLVPGFSWDGHESTKDSNAGGSNLLQNMLWWIHDNEGKQDCGDGDEHSNDSSHSHVDTHRPRQDHSSGHSHDHGSSYSHDYGSSIFTITAPAMMSGPHLTLIASVILAVLTAGAVIVVAVTSYSLDMADALELNKVGLTCM